MVSVWKGEEKWIDSKDKVGVIIVLSFVIISFHIFQRSCHYDENIR